MIADEAPHTKQIDAKSSDQNQSIAPLKNKSNNTLNHTLNNTLNADAHTGVLLVTTKGRYTELLEVSGLQYIKCNDDYLVIAKNNHAQTKPDWYLNLREEPIVQIEIGEIKYYAKAETVTEAERLGLAKHTNKLDRNPTRTIPRDTAVVLLKPLF